MAGRGPISQSILPKLDRTEATCDARAKQFRGNRTCMLDLHVNGTCMLYTVLSSMYAVREWSIDLVEQSHINNARNWMAAVCHEIKETVSLQWCKCGEQYEQWGKRPSPPCYQCAKINVRKALLGETGTEQRGSKGKQAKFESSDGKVKKKARKSNILGKPWKKPKHKLTPDTFSPTHCTVRG